MSEQRITLDWREPVSASKRSYPSGCGVYAIRCAANGRFYIGSSVDLSVRLSRHFTTLRGGRHENTKLQRHFNKYGEASFVVEVLEMCGSDELDRIEQQWIDQHWHTKMLLNVQRTAGRPPSFDELEPEVRERKREAHRRSSTGRPVSEKLLALLAARRGASNPCFGTKWTPERLEHMRLRMSGAGSPSFGKTGAQSKIFGIKRSAETRQRMSENNRWRGKGSEHPDAKRCRRTEANGAVSEFFSANEAARQLGLGATTVSRWCRKERNPRDGSKWEYVDAC